MSNTPQPQPESTDATSFGDLGLSAGSLENLEKLGYKQPTPIQKQAIPLLLAGRDLIGQAQTGTGKTAAFALPLVERINVQKGGVQALILTPTRELALQVSSALGEYSRSFARVRIAAVYGGSSISTQIRMIERGAQIVVGTPGRVLDLMRRNKLRLNDLQMIVLDEADEMLRMGFIEDVEWVLSHAPDERQLALFSATMPAEVTRIAKRHTRNPAHIEVAKKAVAMPNIEQSYLVVPGHKKVEALVRMIECEDIAAGLVFVRTKASCAELASRLAQHGVSIEPLNGDMSQEARESTVRRLRSGAIDLVVATDVAARGLDIERLSHVINYDPPGDVETYVHRIGRTGRAGRAGKAILFVTQRERWLVTKIEQYTKHPVAAHKLPSNDDIAVARREDVKRKLREVLSNEALGVYLDVIREVVAEGKADANLVAAAALHMLAGEQPLDPRQFPSIDVSFEDKRNDRKRYPGKGSSRKKPFRKGENHHKNRARGKGPRVRSAKSGPKAGRPREDRGHSSR